MSFQGNPTNNVDPAPNALAIKHERRSTRIPEAVRVSVSGQSKAGSPFSELTLTLAVNCHGCVYPSRNEPEKGSWVTLGFPNQISDPKAQPVRAQVRFVRAPQNPNEHCEVGVELESPANIWRIESAPEDWLRFPASLDSTAGDPSRSSHPMGAQVVEQSAASADAANQKLQTSTSVSDRPDRVTSSPDQFLRALEKNIRLAAEKAVELAVTSHLNPAVHQAITAIDKFGQAGVRQIAEHSTHCKEKVISLAQDELSHRIQADLTNAEERLEKKLELSLSEIQEKVEEETKNATSKGHLILAESVDFLKDTSRDLQEKFSASLREATDRTAAELSAETVRFSDRQLALLNKQVQAAITESSALLDARAADARSQLETAANTLIDNFNRKASVEIERASVDARQNFMSSLTSFADEARVAWETRQRAWQDEIVRANQQQCEQFRQRLDAILQSSVVTAVSSINQHSSALLNSLSKKPEEQPMEVAHEMSR
jgi:hypothetical protein